MPESQPFELHVSQDVLDDLHERLARTRWPNELPGVGWNYGIPRDYLQELLDYWQHDFDWRAQEARLNALPNYRVEIGGLGVHYIHVRGKGPSPIPLLLAHGYPSSPFEYLPLISLLTDPATHGGDPADAFDVVVPSIPGHGFSDMPDRIGFEDRAVAGMFVELMDGLGYERFGIHAYDIAASICQYLNFDYPDRVIGYHTTNPSNPGPTLTPDSEPLSEVELDYQKLRQAWGKGQGAYARILGTKHQALAYGLNDSPAGLAAWIVEKWYAWTVPPTGNLEDHFTKDELLANVMSYWVTETINSANRYYAEDLEPLGPEDRISVPTGVAMPTNDPSNQPPREYVERLHTDIRYWVDLEGGGHFVAGEMPGPVAESIRTFFRELRDGASGNA
jgi:pimeloyl-ACP methyl ester carboxylesterase